MGGEGLESTAAPSAPWGWPRWRPPRGSSCRAHAARVPAFLPGPLPGTTRTWMVATAVSPSTAPGCGGAMAERPRGPAPILPGAALTAVPYPPRPSRAGCGPGSPRAQGQRVVLQEGCTAPVRLVRCGAVCGRSLFWASAALRGDSKAPIAPNTAAVLHLEQPGRCHQARGRPPRLPQGALQGAAPHAACSLPARSCPAGTGLGAVPDGRRCDASRLFRRRRLRVTPAVPGRGSARPPELCHRPRGTGWDGAGRDSGTRGAGRGPAGARGPPGGRAGGGPVPAGAGGGAAGAGAAGPGSAGRGGAAYRHGWWVPGPGPPGRAAASRRPRDAALRRRERRGRRHRYEGAGNGGRPRGGAGARGEPL